MRASEVLMTLAGWALVLPLVWGLLAASDRWLSGGPRRRLSLYHFRLLRSDRTSASATDLRTTAVWQLHPGKKKRAQRTA